MASFSTRKSAPLWPPFKSSYNKLGESDDIQMMLRPDIDTAASHNSQFYPSPTPRQTTFADRKPRRFHGWRGGAKVAFIGAVSVFTVNLILLIAMSVGFEHMDGMTMIYIGSCTKTQQINIGIHLLVNVLSTGLLAGSSYCMQILTAPTRNDIDMAHAKGTWLDIGIVSLRNLRSLRKQKVILWWLLAASSIPLHLFYNSVFFTAIATNDYNILYATEAWVNGAAYDKQRFPDTKWLNVTELQKNAKTYERLDNAACIGAYAIDFVTERKDVIAVVQSNSSLTTSLLKNDSNVLPPSGFNKWFDAYAWICDDPTTLARTDNINGTYCAKMSDQLQQMANQSWRSGGYEIQYCLSQRIEPDCHVHFAPPIMAPVLFFNIMKALIIAYVAFYYKDQPIVTLGDAIESFTLEPDVTTKGMCLATKEVVEHQWTRGYIPQPMSYDGSRRRWYQSATRKQWSLFAAVSGAMAIAIAICIQFGVLNSDPKTIASAWAMGIGKVRTQNLITGLQVTSLGANAVFVSAFIANSPQAVFSFIYLIYNNVFTTMVLSNEWDRFSIKSGKGRVLRVSNGRGDQRSTYFLQIPYRYAIVMLVTSGLLHWLVSQSIFLANISVIPLDGIKPKEDEITTCAYSVQAMFYVVVLGMWMLIWLGGNGLRRFSGGMPFVGSNSAAISAACHTEYSLRCEREAMVLKPLRWGVTDYGSKKTPRLPDSGFDTPPASRRDQSPGKAHVFERSSTLRYDEANMSDEALSQLPVGHCTFTDGRVAKPVSGRLYA